jgi:hypothetical protein
LSKRVDFEGELAIVFGRLSAPLIAGVYALAGKASKVAPGYVYRHAGWLFDVTKGTNVFGGVCGGDYLCVAKRGYDAPTGLGTPDGTGAFWAPRALAVKDGEPAAIPCCPPFPSAARHGRWR